LISNTPIKYQGEACGRVICRFIVLLLHLLKWQFQPEYLSNSWKGSIIEYCKRMFDFLEESPSLQPFSKKSCQEPIRMQ